MTGTENQPPQAGTDDAKVTKRSVTIAGHRTSVTLEGIFWRALQQSAQSRGISLSALITQIDAQPRSGGLSTALRVFAMRSALNQQNPDDAQPA